MKGRQKDKSTSMPATNRQAARTDGQTTEGKADRKTKAEACRRKTDIYRENQFDEVQKHTQKLWTFGLQL